MCVCVSGGAAAGALMNGNSPSGDEERSGPEGFWRKAGHQGDQITRGGASGDGELDQVTKGGGFLLI